MAAPLLDEAAIFDVARQISSEVVRRKYFQQVCGEDELLKARVEALLQVHDSEHSFLKPPERPSTGVATSHASEGVGSIVGQYKLVEQIGDGGFGLVYMAEQQQPMRRKVALKVLKPGMDTKQVLARFEAERQALALMEHENIARVLDGGEAESGRPFFVMELVKGIPITQYCDVHRLTLRERLSLFLPVCQAVQHAHQKGIIHRDLKPSNVLVAAYDGKPVPKVIDFGVAKALGQQLTNRTLITNFGGIIGTLEYMSPEQAEFNALDIDTRADIYSLGVLLYELLTGTTPLTHERLKQAAVTEVLRLIREEDPPKPSTRISDSKDSLASISAQRKLEPTRLTKELRGELDWIVMKCLEKDRNRRYETANGIVRDIEGYLHDEVVKAGPPSFLYRWKKFARRHRVLVSAIALVLSALLLGVLGTSIGLYWAVRERDDKARALLAETRERQDKERALTAETQARASERQAHAKALAALRDLTDEVVENRMAQSTQLSEDDREFLRKLLRHFEGLASVTADDVESRAIRAEGSQRVARMRQLLGELKEAEEAYHDALVLQKQLVADFLAQPDFRQELAVSLSNFGNLLSDTGRLKEAEAHHREALAIRKKLAIEFPTRHRLRYELAQSFSILGGLLNAIGQAKEAEEARRDAIALRQQLVTEFPAVPYYRQDLARSYSILGFQLKNLGQRTAAEQAFQQALTICEKLTAEFPTRRDFRQDLAESHHNLGLLFHQMGPRQLAEPAYRRALELQEKLADEYPTVPRYRLDLATSHNSLGVLLGEMGKLSAAEQAFRRALSLHQKLASDFPNVPDYRQDLAGSLNNLGIALVAMKRTQAARQAYSQALSICEKLVADFPAVTAYRNLLAGNCVNFGNFLEDEEAEQRLAWFDKGIGLLKPQVDHEPGLIRERLFLRNAYWGRANALDLLGRHTDALKDWDQALALNSEPANDLGFRTNRARSKALAGDHAQAATEAEALSKGEKVDGLRLYSLARVIALAAASVQNDATLRDKYADRAIELIRQGVAKGFKDSAQLKTNKDLEAIRNLEDFKKLLIEVEAKK